MGRLKALSLAGMIMFGGAGSALAADLLPPPPPVDAPLRGAIFDNSGFYVRGDAGVAINNPGPGSSAVINPPPGLTYDWQHEGVGAIVGLGAGYQFNNWFRADLTGEWHDGGTWTSQESYTSGACAQGNALGRCLDQYSAKINHGVFLVNGYADLGTWGGLTPYLGVGLGTAYNSIGGISDTFPTFPGTPSVSPAVSKWTFAWALMAGVSFDITQNLKMDVSYRYLNMGSMDGGTINCCGSNIYETQHFKFSSNDIRVGLRYMFGEAPPPPPPVLVRKY